MTDLQDAFIGDRLRLTGHDIERRKKFVGLEVGDAARIAAVRDVVVQNADKFSARLFQKRVSNQWSEILIWSGSPT